MRPSRAGSMAFVLLLAFGVGQCSAEDKGAAKSSARPPEPAPTKTVTKTVTNTEVKKVEVNRLPTDCRNAIDLARKIGDAAVPLMNSAGTAEDIMSDAHQAMTESNGSKLNELRTKMYQLDGQQSKSSVDLSVYLMPSFRQSLEACEKATQ